MRFEFKVEVEIERESGKFASRDEVSSQIEEALAEADYGQWGGVGADGDSVYATAAWDVSEVSG